MSVYPPSTHLRWVALALFACDRSDDPAPDSPAPMVSAAPLAGARVPYHCTLAPDRDPGSCAQPPIADLIRLDALGAFFVSPGVARPESAPCGDAERALAWAEGASLDLPQRIVAQNAALRVFARGGELCAGIEARAAGVVHALAPSASELASLGDTLPAWVDAWLGPRSGWRDMRPRVPGRGPTLEHDRVNRYTRAFRPLRSGSVRAIVSALVAIDSEWQPHVTPIVGELSLRHGLEPDAPACVAEIDLACDITTVAAVERLDAVKPSPFVSVSGDGVMCNSCHHPSKETGANLEPIDDSAIATARREAFLVQARALAASVRSRCP